MYRNNRLPDIVGLDPTRLNSDLEKLLWKGFMDQIGEAKKNRNYPVSISYPQGTQTRQFNVWFDHDVYCLGSETTTPKTQAIMNKIITDIGEIDNGPEDEDVILKGLEAQELVLPETYESREEDVYVWTEHDVTFIDPTHLTPTTTKKLKKVLENETLDEYKTGQMYYDKDGGVIVMLRDLVKYERKQGKTGDRYGVLGEVKGSGAFGEVRDIVGKLKNDETLYFVRPKEEKNSQEKNKYLVVKKIIHKQEETADVTREHAMLERAGFRVKPVKTIRVETEKETELNSYLFMENAGDLSLHDYIYDEQNQKKPLSLHEAIILFREIGTAYLNNVSNPGLVHGDLKPGNIMLKRVSELPRMKIVDYGFAQIKTDLKPIVYTTPGYMPPEIYAQGIASEKSDVFTLGIILLEVLGTRHSYRGEEISAKSGTIEGHGFVLFAEITDSQPHVEAELRKLALRMIAPNPDERPSAKEVVNYMLQCEELLLRPVAAEEEKTESTAVESVSLQPVEQLSKPDEVEHSRDSVGKDHIIPKSEEDIKKEIIDDLLNRIKKLNNKVTTIFGKGGTEIIIDDKKFVLPDGAAKMAAEIQKYPEQISFDRLIANCVKQAKLASERSYLFFSKDPHTSALYEYVLNNLPSKASQDLGSFKKQHNRY